MEPSAMHKMKQWLSPVSDWLLPQTACRMCGTACRHASKDLPVCPACARAIPWIGQPQCLVCGRGMACPDCVRQDMPRHFVCSRSAVRYDGRMKEWLSLYKFRGNEQLRPVVSAMLASAYRRFERSELKPAGLRMDAITYVPLSAQRLQLRGFNQAGQLAEDLGQKFGLPVEPLLEKLRDTDKQSMRNRRQRMQAVEGLYRLQPDAGRRLADLVAKGTGLDGLKRFRGPFSPRSVTSSSPLRLLLIDDVYTTGSTMNACAGVLQNLREPLAIPIEVYGLTWAR